MGVASGWVGHGAAGAEGHAAALPANGIRLPLDGSPNSERGLVVMGSHALLGSDAERVLRQCPVPVLLVRHPGGVSVQERRREPGAARGPDSRARADPVVIASLPQDPTEPPMPWTPEHPPLSMRKLQPAVRRKAVEVANALLREGMEEGKAIRIASAKARAWALQRQHQSEHDGGT